METNISKKEFWNVIKPELAYFNKKWQGSTDEEKSENEKTVLAMYYNSLCFANQLSLEVAFQNHRNTETTFPKIPQLIRHIPKQSETYQTPSYKFSPMPEKVKELQDRKMVVSDEIKLKSAEMIHKRYGTKFDECKIIVELDL